jgi:hypothetical protein
VVDPSTSCFVIFVVFCRYLECNKVDVSARRETVYKLRHKLDILERQLDKYVSGLLMETT